MKCNVDIKCDVDYDKLMFVFKDDWLSRCYKEKNLSDVFSSYMKVIDISLYHLDYFGVECFSNDGHGTKIFGHKIVCKNLLEKCKKINVEEYTAKKNEALKTLGINAEDI
jgi:hypothetical protein